MNNDKASKVTEEEQEDLSELLTELHLVQTAKASQELKRDHRFWHTQPVPKLIDSNSGENCLPGPIVVPQKTVTQVRQQPYHLPNGFKWSTLDIRDPSHLHEVYELLSLNYVEDDANTFRFDYSVEFLQWVLAPPRFHQDWHLGVRSTQNHTLLAFVSAIPTQIRVDSKSINMTEVNFLCVHKRLRDRRLAPVLIKEITRRVNLCNVWQAIYTAGVVFPTPVAHCRYFHRPLNPRKLIETGFSTLSPYMPLSQVIQKFELPSHTVTRGFRSMKRSDVLQVTNLLKNYLTNFRLAAEYSEDEVEHWMVPRTGVVSAYVVEDPDTQEITDVCSFYHLPSTIIGCDKYEKLYAAYSFYNVATSVTLSQLMQDAMIMAKKQDLDVFNALDVMENREILQPLKFRPGSGTVQYYLYNWRCPRMTSDSVGIVLC
ncbi:hypothetical protein PsorP6_017933 [Peronosclerospora sorghi]|uniref:Uncharacterized protein n=1 Tax=Peronosclerospora sorghi TaxID=230839 RepID=A0ACC0WEM1_9STRA|nr:hypothetical protein PsorP6_017933 [Peronosclerospora sorghi]